MSKTLIVLMVGMLAVGCASTPTMKSVAGTYKSVTGAYEGKDVGETIVFLDNGVAEYSNGKAVEGKWKIVERDIHADFMWGYTVVFNINRDGSITGTNITVKSKQITLKKIK